MIIIHAHLQVKPDQEQAFLEEGKILLSATRAEEGNISYDLMKSTEQEHHYTMVEVWKDVEATTLHNTSEHFTAFTQKAKTFMAAPMDLKVFSGEAVKA
ncbi:antibiotic biosynthesis monooxygenase [Peribacillus psychrosaccharolyticus]|uniref:Antibiotic biosynthesis monooxygenase n=1 Tax=Peribacillus psychrosaccharolyticus TaxID=1407 RepID=A0A974S1R8_PERPY|nr:putative quinol monooxygenase [Peribacillus psychrosaccharolyticus]MEC2057515.1 putative quinol monooxygenase [Peribacillus psychrosaccharolyticus]MED3745970.1 putative quinol monooxygenase [Peribacillus psychrosaccharolyticus]QQT01768.1 antibiotic biosynthesis monooxygenase [Peribacillus psychrosaccharolyticus]